MKAILRDYRTYKANDYRNKFIEGKYRNPLLLLLAACVCFLIFSSCGKSSPATPTPEETNAELSAVILLPDGSQRHDIALFIINIDTFKNGDEEFYKVDSLYGRRAAFPQIDSTGKQVLDSTGKPLFVTGWMRTTPDSVSIISYTPISKFTEKFKKSK